MSDSPVSLVTGSGKARVGSVIAEELARLGHRLAIHYGSSKEEAERTVDRFARQGIEATAIQADLRREADIIALVGAVIDRFGKIDVLVNSAAVWGRHKLEEVGAEELLEQWRVNTQATFLCGKHVGLRMANRPEGGCIVNIGDWATVRPYADHSAYFASKGALPTITRALAVELAARNPNVRVNCLLPGPVMLPVDLPEEERRQAIEATLVKREGSPRNLAHAVRFLVENDFVTGVCLPVDGGRSIHASGH